MSDSKKQELEIISNTLGFLQRVELKGAEVQAFNAIQNYLVEKGNALQAQVQAEEGDEQPVPRPVEKLPKTESETKH